VVGAQVGVDDEVGARNRGICENRLNIRRDALEKSILTGLNTHVGSSEAPISKHGGENRSGPNAS
jgi:hypothetical protein